MTASTRDYQIRSAAAMMDPLCALLACVLRLPAQQMLIRPEVQSVLTWAAGLGMRMSEC